MKLLDLINILLNFYTRKGNVPIYYEGDRETDAPWEVKGVEKRDSDDAEKGVKIVIY